MLQASSPRIHKVEVLGGESCLNNTLAHYSDRIPILNPPLSLLRLDTENSQICRCWGSTLKTAKQTWLSKLTSLILHSDYQHEIALAQAGLSSRDKICIKSSD